MLFTVSSVPVPLVVDEIPDPIVRERVGGRKGRSGPLSMDSQTSSFARADNFAISMLSFLTAVAFLVI